MKPFLQPYRLLIIVFFVFSRFISASGQTPNTGVLIPFGVELSGVWQKGESKKVFGGSSFLSRGIMTDTVDPYLPSDTSSFLVFVPVDEQVMNDMDSSLHDVHYWTLEFESSWNLNSGDSGIVEFSVDHQKWHRYPIPTFIDSGIKYINAGLEEVFRDSGYYAGSHVNLGDTILIRLTLFSSGSLPKKDGWFITDLGRANVFDASVGERFKETLRIFPNPVRGELKVQLDDKEVVHLYDLHGRLVDSWNGQIGVNSLKLDNVSLGTYLLTAGNRFAKIVVR